MIHLARDPNVMLFIMTTIGLSILSTIKDLFIIYITTALVVLYFIGSDSYLRVRTQSVKIKNNISKSFLVISGVPQCLHLGPILFILYINDVGKCFSRTTIFLIYADDIKIYSIINGLPDALAL